MSRPDNLRDNAHAETFFRALNHGEVFANDLSTIDDVADGLPHLLEDVYNRGRLPSPLVCMPPDECESRQAACSLCLSTILTEFSRKMIHVKRKPNLSRDEFYETLDEQVPGETEGLTEALSNNHSLYFSRISMDGLEEMFEYSKDSRLYEYFEFEPHKTIDETKRYLEKLISRTGLDVMERSAMYWFVRRLSDNRMVGTGCLVNIDFDRHSVEWGYGVDPSLWGEGHILEMTALMKSYVFETLAMNRLYGKAMMRNERTKSSLLGSGMQEEGILRQFYYRPLTESYHDAWAYSMLAEDYFSDKEESEHVTDQANIETDSPSVSAVNEVVCEILNVGNLSSNADMATIPAWDSISHLEVVIAVERKFGCKFLPAEIGRVRSINIIHEIISQKLQAS